MMTCGTKKQKMLFGADEPGAKPAAIGLGVAMTLLVIVWWAMGIAAFVYSLVCIGKTPSTWRSVLGVVLALLLGPFYFVYLWADPAYCRGESFRATAY
jgi:hypothetical protein